MSKPSPSYSTGFASPQRGRMKYPSLWRGCVGAWCPALGPSGLTLRDNSGYGNHGTLTNMDPPTDWVVSGGKYALDFDNSDDRVVIPDSVKDLTADMTVSAWAKSPTPAASNDNHMFGFYGTTSPFSGWGFNFGNSLGTRRGLRFYDGIAWRNSSADVWSENTWTHAAATIVGTSLTFFINGAIAGTATVSNANRTWTGRKDIGGAGGTNLFSGTLDSLAIYERALSASEIMLLASRRGIAYETTQRRSYKAAAAGGGFKAAWASQRTQMIGGGNR